MSTKDKNKQQDTVVRLPYLSYQPIFNSNKKVWGYELFSSENNGVHSLFTSFNTNIDYIYDLIAEISICPDKGFNNTSIILTFCHNDILNDIPLKYPSDLITVQLTDSVQLPVTLYHKIKTLKEAGYQIAINQFLAQPANEWLYNLTDIISGNLENIHPLTKIQTNFPEITADYLVKNIDKKQNLSQAKENKYHLFQGEYFKEPPIEETRKITSIEMIRLELLSQLCRVDLNFETLCEIISRDSTISIRLINLLSSPIYGLVHQISSLKQAAVYLGMDQLRHWLRIIVLSDIGGPELSKEILRTSLVRAKFLFLLSSLSGKSEAPKRLFLVGMFSLIDTMLQVPMQTAISFISALEGSIRETILGEETEFYLWLQLSLTMEKSQWNVVGAISAKLHLNANDIMKSYAESIKWANKCLEGCST